MSRAERKARAAARRRIYALAMLDAVHKAIDPTVGKISGQDIAAVLLVVTSKMLNECPQDKTVVMDVLRDVTADIGAELQRTAEREREKKP